jgi:hypothetical protein
MNTPCAPRVRSLFAWEIQEARRVFKLALAYEKVRIHECTTWPNTIKRVGSWLQRSPYTGIDNAVTLGNHCYFPVRLLEQILPPVHPDFKKFPWLIHELTHVWQFQHLGWKYLTQSLAAQVRLGAQAYAYGGEQNLIDAHQLGRKLGDFNLEQQGDIARDYYWCLARGQDPGAWQPFIDEISQVA